jgi:hypothetical protein
MGTNVSELQAPDEDKFTELVLYVAKKIESDPTGGATKINKILFFSEFASVRSRGVPITGVEYQKLANGPAPRRLRPVRDQLIEEGSAELRIDEYFGLALHRLISLRDADESLFEDGELRTVDQVIEALWGKTASEVSNMSHEEKGWQMVEDGEAIPCSAAYLVPTFRPTQAMQDHALELSSRMAKSFEH